MTEGTEADTSPSDGDQDPAPRGGRRAVLRRGLASWLTAHWWTGIGGVIGVLGLVVGILAWLVPAGEGGSGSGGAKADSGMDERWSATMSVADAPLDLDAMPPTRNTDRASGDIWVNTTEALKNDAAVIEPGELSSIRKWTLTDEPSVDSCRSEVRRPGEKEASVTYGDFFCVRTSEDRIAVIAVDSIYQEESGTVGAELSVTVYEKREL
jgi:hypothetical protein